MTKINQHYVRLLCGAAAISSQVLVLEAAYAQANEAAAYKIDEIIVTANKREENLNDVGQTITAFSGDALAERQIVSLSDIAAVVPGLEFAQSTSNTPILTLRGIGFNAAALGAYPAVSAYVDQFPLPFPVLAAHSAYDLQRVEVLKGPQGTLFGQNSTGGAINFIAAKPTNEFEAGMDTTYGRFNNIEGNFYISGPLSDTLRARISGTDRSMDGWQVSDTRPNDRNGKQSYLAGRVLLDWDASESIRFSLNVNGWSDKGEPQAPQFVTLVSQSPGFPNADALVAQFSGMTPRSADWSLGIWEPRSDRTFIQAGLRTDIDLSDDLTLTALTSYIDFDQDQVQDFDGLPLNITDFAESGHIKSFNQELRIANSPASSLRWVLGGNYEKSDTYDYQLETFSDNSTANNPGAGFIDNSFQYVDQDIENYAVFGNLEYDLTSQLTAKAGIRYTKTRNNAQLCTGDGGSGRIIGLFNFLGGLSGQPFDPITFENCPSLNAQGVPNGDPSSLTLKEDNVAWRAGLDYKISSDTLVYANISRGYKAGSFPMIPASATQQYFPVKQESVTAYEVGLKADLMDRRVHLNAAAFYYDYKDKQVLGKVVNPIFGPSNALVNVPKSRVYGFDADLTVRPADGLTITSSITYLNSEVSEYQGYNFLGQFLDFAGDDLPFTPEWSYNIDLEYKPMLNNGGSPFIGVMVTGKTGQDTTIGGSNLTIPAGPANRVAPGIVHPLTTKAYATVDGRIGYEGADGRWRVSIFARNIFNKYYWNNVVDQAEVAQRYAGMPATYGITFGIKY